MGNVSTKSVSVTKSSYVPSQDLNASPVVQAIQGGNIFSALPMELMHELLGRIAQGERATIGAFARVSHVTSNGAGRRLLTERILHMVEVPWGKKHELSHVQSAIKLLTKAGYRRDPEQVMPLFKKIINYLKCLAPAFKFQAEKAVLDALVLFAPKDQSELLLLMAKTDWIGHNYDDSISKDSWNARSKVSRDILFRAACRALPESLSETTWLAYRAFTPPQYVGDNLAYLSEINSNLSPELSLVLDQCAELPLELRLPILLAVCRSPERHCVLGRVLEQARTLPKVEKAQVLAGLNFRMGFRPYPNQGFTYSQAILKETLDLAEADLALVLEELLPTLCMSMHHSGMCAMLDQVLGQLQALPQQFAAPLIAPFAEVNKGMTDRGPADLRSDALRVMIASFPDESAKAPGFSKI